MNESTLDNIRDNYPFAYLQMYGAWLGLTDHMEWLESSGLAKEGEIEQLEQERQAEMLKIANGAPSWPEIDKRTLESCQKQMREKADELEAWHQLITSFNVSIPR